MIATFAMCSHPNCPARGHCLRHQKSGTKPGPFQRYEDFYDKPNGKGECSGLMLKPRVREPAHQSAAGCSRVEFLLWTAVLVVGCVFILAVAG